MNDNKLRKIELVELKTIKNLLRNRSSNSELDEALSESINRDGLTQPIVLRKTEKGIELIDGRRRKKAYSDLGFKVIPAIFIKKKTIEAEICSLSGNLFTLSPTGYERDQQTARLRDLNEALEGNADVAKDAASVDSKLAKKLGQSKRGVKQSKARLKNASSVILKQYQQKKINQSRVDELIKLDKNVQSDALALSADMSLKKLRRFTVDCNKQGFAVTRKAYHDNDLADSSHVLESLTLKMIREITRVNKGKFRLFKASKGLKKNMEQLVLDIEILFENQKIISRAPPRRRRAGKSIQLQAATA